MDTPTFTATPLRETRSPLQMVLITGMSGSGKSVALHALEDAGFYCVDNLPPELLMPFAEHVRRTRLSKVAVAVDVRSATALPEVPAHLQRLRDLGWDLRGIFLDASTETLIHRFSETRRRHPLSQHLRRSAPRAATDGLSWHKQSAQSDQSDQQHALLDAIELERNMLSGLRELAQVIDTSVLRSAQLQTAVKALIDAPADRPTLVFQSFSFKRGVPSDADYVFDLRMLPNPFYEPELRQLNGRDAPVAHFLAAQAEVRLMLDHITQFLNHWLPALAQNHRSYVTVALGCTGGQHRSVYLAECLNQAFQAEWHSLTRHREIDS
jgi:RNase adapter protein RapZ